MPPCPVCDNSISIASSIPLRPDKPAPPGSPPHRSGLTRLANATTADSVPRDVIATPMMNCSQQHQRKLPTQVLQQ
jgi:hypothetical protein